MFINVTACVLAHPAAPGFVGGLRGLGYPRSRATQAMRL
jgi:hypothetical protein